MKDVDAFVCKPDLLINDQRTAVFIRFELMNPDTRQGIGKHHQIALTTSDAMRLFGLLEAIQKRFDLPKPLHEPEHVRVPGKKEQN